MDRTRERTGSQKMAEAAYNAVASRLGAHNSSQREKYTSFARSFPSLMHSCGLAQAVAFARAKDHGCYLEDLALVLGQAGHPEVALADALERATREHAVHAYVRLSRNALQASGWIKRYVEALNLKS